MEWCIKLTHSTKSRFTEECNLLQINIIDVQCLTKKMGGEESRLRSQKGIETLYLTTIVM